jgi:hypothetical protein
MAEWEPESQQEQTSPFAERVSPLAGVVIAASGLTALGIVGFSLTRWVSGLSPSQIVVYYLLPALWVAISLLALRRSAEARVGFALFQLSVGCSLLVAEVGATVLLRAKSAGPPRPSLLDEVRQLRASGADAFQAIAGNQLVDLNPQVLVGRDTLHVVTPAPGHAIVRLCNEDRPMLTYASDRYGFDNPDSVWLAGSNSVTVIGDSYTVGVCVPSADAIPGRLRATRPVVNLGISGSGPLQQLALLREYGAQVKSKQVVWILYEGNDFWDLAREADRAWLTRYLSAGHVQALAAQAAAVNSGYRQWIDSISARAPEAAAAAPSFSLRDILTMRALRALVPVSVPLPGSGASIGLLPTILARANAEVREWGGELVVVYMPAYLRYRTVIGDPFPERALVLAELRAQGIRVVDLYEQFGQEPNPKALWVTPRSHLTAQGYHLAASVIERSLRDAQSSSGGAAR